MYRMVIADDERAALKSLELFMKKEFPEIEIVGTAGDGITAEEMILKLKPDLAVVDVNMPGKNGIDMIGSLRDLGADTRFVVNTAYSEFDYVKRAIDLKVDGYFLKPEKRDSMIQTISRILTSIKEKKNRDEDRERYIKLVKEMQPVLENEVMYSLFMNEGVEHSVDAYLKLRRQEFHGANVLSVVNVETSIEKREEIRRNLRNLLDGLCTAVFQVSDVGISILVFGEEQEKTEREQWLGDIIFIVMESLDKISGGFRMGVGGFAEEKKDLSRSYQESMAALRKSDQRISYFSGKPAEGETGQSPVTVNKTADHIVSCLIAGNLKDALTITEQFVEAAGAEQEECAKLFTACIRKAAAYKGGKMELHSVSRSVLHVFRDTPDHEMGLLMKDRIRQVFQMFFEDSEAGGDRNRYVIKAVRCIESDFAQDLSLDMVAEKIGISPFYLSRLMKQELGVTFVEYLTLVRMSEAVRLAEETDDTLAMIAAKTGYQNVAYFCRVFKKNMGKTIGEWRRDLDHDV